MSDTPFNNRRALRRHRLSKDFDLIIQGRPVRAVLNDISAVGLGIILKELIYFESPFVDIKISEANIDTKGKAVWVERTPDGLGLKVGIQTSGPISGRLDYFGFPDLIMGLNKTGKTGVLEINSGGTTGKIRFINGEAALSGADLEFEKKIIMEMLDLEHGEFVFREGSLAEEEQAQYRLNIGNLIYHWTKKTVSAEQIRRYSPPMDSVLYLPEDMETLVGKIRLDENGKTILSMINGKHTLKDIISLSSFDETDIVKTVCALSRAQIIEEVPDISHTAGTEGAKEDSEPDPGTLEKIERLYSDHKKLGYHGMLGIGIDASLPEIKHAYHKMAKEFHPDRYLHFRSDALKAKINDLFVYINEAYRELSKARQEFYEMPVEEHAHPVKDDNRELARQRFREGRESLDRGRHAQALTLLGQAVYLDKAVAEYHFYYGIALLRSKKVKPAEESIKTALQLDQYNSEYLTELGYIYLHLGFMTRAKHTFERALKYDTSNERAEKGIKEAEG